jgi:hypothetical protein
MHWTNNTQAGAKRALSTGKTRPDAKAEPIGILITLVHATGVVMT